MAESERELAARLAAGDPAAFASLYAAHGSSLYAYLRAATGRPETAEDLLQTVWIRLVRYRRRLAQVESLRAYLFAMARNELSRRRAGRPESLPVDAASEPVDPQAPVGEDDDVALRRAVDRLSAERREVVALKAWHHLTFAEIGEVLAISPHTAASRYRLALADLEAMLRETIHASR